jgi:hypothetical protein
VDVGGALGLLLAWCLEDELEEIREGGGGGLNLSILKFWRQVGTGTRASVCSSLFVSELHS